MRHHIRRSWSTIKTRLKRAGEQAQDVA